MPQVRSSASGSRAEFSFLFRSYFWRGLIVFSIVAVVYVAQQEKRLDMYVHEDEHHLFATSPTERCMDADDEPQNSTVMRTACSCGDPLVPTPIRTALWAQRHQQLEAAALAAALEGVEVAFVGDSIVEHFGGTRKMGQLELREEAEVFAKFSQAIASVALGCSGDTSPNLLYHLQHGVLHRRLKPQVWVIVIGTNDLSKGCSKRTTLAGILQVAQLLHQQRPNSRILVHGLFPRVDDDGRLNQLWGKIVWINQQLKKFCGLHSEWMYADVNNHMLHKVKRDDGSSEITVKPGLLLDGLHPSAKGYDLWSKELLTLLEAELKNGD